MSSTKTLAQLREEAGYTQAVVAQKTGLSQGQISKMEAMYPEVRFDRLRDYLYAIGVGMVFTDWDTGETAAKDVIADPARAEYVRKRKEDPSRGRAMASR